MAESGFDIQARISPEEHRVHIQVRATLETQCVELFHALRNFYGTLFHLPLTVVVFDFGDGTQRFQNVAFKTNLQRPDLVSTFQTLLRSWRGQAARSPVEGMTAEMLVTFLDHAKRKLPAGVGCALLIGVGERSAYVSSAERSGMIEMIEKSLLPRWREI